MYNLLTGYDGMQNFHSSRRKINFTPGIQALTQDLSSSVIKYIGKGVKKSAQKKLTLSGIRMNLKKYPWPVKTDKLMSYSVSIIRFAGIIPVAAADTMLPATPGPSPATYIPLIAVSR